MKWEFIMHICNVLFVLGGGRRVGGWKSGLGIGQKKQKVEVVFQKGEKKGKSNKKWSIQQNINKKLKFIQIWGIELKSKILSFSFIFNMIFKCNHVKLNLEVIRTAIDKSEPVSSVFPPPDGTSATTTIASTTRTTTSRTTSALCG